MEYYILKCYQEAKNNCVDVEMGFDRFDLRIKNNVIICFLAMVVSCIEMIFTMLLFPNQLWYCMGIIGLGVTIVILIVIDNKDQKNHMDRYVDSHKKKLEILDEVLKNKFNINNKEKKQNRIILAIFSAFAGALTISFENIGNIGITLINWINLATFLFIFVAVLGGWIYSYNLLDTMKRKYELMMKDLKELLLIKY